VSDNREGEGKVVLVLNEVPHHEDILCLTKHHSLKTYPVLN